MDRHGRVAAAFSRQQLHDELGRQVTGDVKLSELFGLLYCVGVVA